MDVQFSLMTWAWWPKRQGKRKEKHAGKFKKGSRYIKRAHSDSRFPSGHYYCHNTMSWFSRVLRFNSVLCFCHMRWNLGKIAPSMFMLLLNSLVLVAIVPPFDDAWNSSTEQGAHLAPIACCCCCCSVTKSCPTRHNPMDHNFPVLP